MTIVIRVIGFIALCFMFSVCVTRCFKGNFIFSQREPIKTENLKFDFRQKSDCEMYIYSMYFLKRIYQNTSPTMFVLKNYSYSSYTPNYTKEDLTNKVINAGIKRKYIPHLLMVLATIIEEDKSGNIQTPLLNVLKLLKRYKRKYNYILLEVLKLSVKNYLQEMGAILDYDQMAVGDETFVIGGRLFEMGDLGGGIGKERDTAYAMYQFAIDHFRSLAARGRMLELRDVWNVSCCNFQFMADVLKENIVLDKMELCDLLDDVK